MKYLLDTSVISEACKPRPAAEVVEWFASTDELQCALSVMTLGELQKGIERLPASKRRRHLSDFLESIAARFEDRLLPVTPHIARTWGVLMARSSEKGRPAHGVDALIAATAKANDLTVVTRNVKDFAHLGVEVLNPFSAVEPSSS